MNQRSGWLSIGNLNLKFYFFLASFLFFFQIYSSYTADTIQIHNYRVNQKEYTVGDTVNNKYGLISIEDGNEKIILQPVYDEIEEIAENYYKIKLGNKFGLVVKNEKILNPEYYYIKYYSKYFIIFDLNILFSSTKIYFFWILFSICIFSIIVLIYFFFRYRNFSRIYYVSNVKKLVIKTNNLLLKSLTLSLAMVFFPPWAILLEYSFWINSFLTFSLLFLIDLFISIQFIEQYNKIRNSFDSKFVKSDSNVFPAKGLYFIDIMYNAGGEKKFFLVKNLKGDWIIIDKRLRIFKQYSFEKFIAEKDHIFIFREDKKEYYILISGSKPRVNQKIV